MTLCLFVCQVDLARGPGDCSRSYISDSHDSHDSHDISVCPTDQVALCGAMGKKTLGKCKACITVGMNVQLVINLCYSVFILWCCMVHVTLV